MKAAVTQERVQPPALECRQCAEFDRMDQRRAGLPRHDVQPVMGLGLVRPAKFPRIAAAQKLVFREAALAAFLEQQMTEQEIRRIGGVIRIVAGFQNIDLVLKSGYDPDYS